jgi:hypothetical protein
MMWKKIKTIGRHVIAAATGGIGGLLASTGSHEAQIEGIVEMSQEPITAIATAVALAVYAIVEKLLKNLPFFAGGEEAT